MQLVLSNTDSAADGLQHVLGVSTRLDYFWLALLSLTRLSAWPPSIHKRKQETELAADTLYIQERGKGEKDSERPLAGVWIPGSLFTQSFLWARPLAQPPVWTQRVPPAHHSQRCPPVCARKTHQWNVIMKNRKWDFTPVTVAADTAVAFTNMLFHLISLPPVQSHSIHQNTHYPSLPTGSDKINRTLFTIRSRPEQEGKRQLPLKWAISRRPLSALIANDPVLQQSPTWWLEILMKIIFLPLITFSSVSNQCLR